MSAIRTGFRASEGAQLFQPAVATLNCTKKVRGLHEYCLVVQD